MYIKSSFPEIAIPNVDLWSFLFDRSNVKPANRVPLDKVLIIDPIKQRNFTYVQLCDLTQQFATALQDQFRWQKGECLTIFAPNCPEYLFVAFGTIRAGGILSPASSAFGVDELTYQLRDCGARAIVTYSSLLATAVAAADACGISQERIIVVDSDGSKSSIAWGIQTFGNFVRKSEGVSFVKPTIDPQKDVATLPYSSGTTGRPKGVLLSHCNLIANTLQCWGGQNNGDFEAPVSNGIFLAFLPMSHIYAFTLLNLTSIFGGRTIVILPKFDLQTFCELTQKYRTTEGYVVPPILTALAKHPMVESYDLSSLRHGGVMCAAAPLSKDLIEAFYARLQIPVTQAYGMTETAPGVTTLAVANWAAHKGSIGPVLSNAEVRIVSPDGADVAPGEPGELWTRGPNVFLGYHNNPAATASALTEDGYYKSGDIARVDTQSGYLYITDRVKELIKYKGFQVAPAELEGVIASHPKIADVAVIGVWRERDQTEVPMANVVVQPDVVADGGLEADLHAWVGGRVAAYKRLKGGIRFCNEIPKNPTGKILRRVLKEQVETETNGKEKAKL